MSGYQYKCVGCRRKLRQCDINAPEMDYLEPGMLVPMGKCSYCGTIVEVDDAQIADSVVERVRRLIN